MADARLFFLLTTTANFSLLPLLPEAQETPIKLCMYLVYTVLSYCVLNTELTRHQMEHNFVEHGLVLHWWEYLYFLGFPAIEFNAVFVDACCLKPVIPVSYCSLRSRRS